jgi:hypothetical protein
VRGFAGMQTAVVVGSTLAAPCSHCRGTGEEPAPGRLIVSIELPMRLVSELNMHEHYRLRMKRRRNQAAAVNLALMAATWHAPVACPPSRPLDVQFTRVAPRSLDSDNLVSSFKAARDAIAKYLCIDDKSDLIDWLKPKQERGAPKQYALKIEIRERRGA